MDVEEMYEDFRNQYLELTKAADARQIEILGSVEHEAAFLWFESLAGVLNAQMGISEQRTEFAAIFMYFDMKFRTGSKEVKNCIDVSFVENLFWEVSPKNAAPVWATLPKNLQQLYIDFHGRSPTLP
jgi:hypothetical protein